MTGHPAPVLVLTAQTPAYVALDVGRDINPLCRTCRNRPAAGTTECARCLHDSITDDKSYARAAL